MADSPLDAEIPQTTAPTRVYEGDGITVEWRADRCIHTANCLNELPDVFDTSARPWIDVTKADPGAIVDAVRACPTGALRYSSDALPPDDGTDEGVMIEAQPNGPLFVRGPVRVTDHEDLPITNEPRMALCRCGSSENKPFCDNTHKKIAWQEAGGSSQS